MPRSIPENMTLDAKMRVLDYTTSDIDVYSQNWTNVTKAYNETLKVEIPILPSEMKFGEQNIIAITVYVLLFLIAASGNLTVFITLCRSKVPKPRINLYILHLSAADLIVTFIMMPLEIAWSLTVDWRAGDAACRILMFFRAFGLYLSSFVLVVISIDRCFAILQPMSLNDADKRGKIMLLIAWLFSLAASAPQSTILSVITGRFIVEAEDTVSCSSTQHSAKNQRPFDLKFTTDPNMLRIALTKKFVSVA